MSGGLANTKNKSSEDETETTIAMDAEDSPEDIKSSATTNYHENLHLCCPLTKKPFREPVVHPNGQTYELRAIQDLFVNVKYYPNRALQHYLNSNIELNNELNESNGVFYCPLSQTLLRDPVIDPEGNTFERHVILEWIREHGVSPITRTPLSPNQLYVNSIILVLLPQTNQQDKNHRNDDIENWKKEVSKASAFEQAKEGVDVCLSEGNNQETEEMNQSSRETGTNPAPFLGLEGSVSHFLPKLEDLCLQDESPNQTVNARGRKSALLCCPKLSRTKWLVLLASILAIGLLVLFLVSPRLASCALAIAVAGILAVCHLGS